MKLLKLPRNAVYTGNLILVNAQFPLMECVDTSTLVPVHQGAAPVLLERKTARALDCLMAELDGWRAITPVSGWRSLQEQQNIYAQSLRDSGQEFTRKFVALPGHSEHQTGHAIDLGLTRPNIDFICPKFPDEVVCGEFRRRAAAFGFVERYPAGRETATGIAYEPWHFRYVGTPHAAIMAERSLTLEEYHDFLKEHPHGENSLTYQESHRAVSIFYVETQGSHFLLRVNKRTGFIIWMMPYNIGLVSRGALPASSTSSMYKQYREGGGP